MIFEAVLIYNACAANPWFTPRFVSERLQIVCDNWKHSPSAAAPTSISHIGIVAAGNIPLVCEHDLLCACLATEQSRNKVTIEIKLSAKDSVLLPVLWSSVLERMRSQSNIQVVFTESLSDSVQAILFSGGTQAQAFYKAKYPNVPILDRTSRTSVAVLDGTESSIQLEGLAYDCFSYFGLGCRNVTGLWVPNGYDFTAFIQAVERQIRPGAPLEDLRTHKGFCNAYRQARAIAQIEGEPFTDGNEFLLQPSLDLFPPVSVLHYAFYDSATQVDEYLQEHSQDIQCIVGRNIPFGKAQFPAFYDFADGINTLEWLQKL